MGWMTRILESRGLLGDNIDSTTSKTARSSGDAETEKLLVALRQEIISKAALHAFVNTTSVRQSDTNHNEFWINLWTVENGAEIADWLENQSCHFTLEMGAANFLVVLHFQDSDAAMMFKLTFLNE